MWSRRARIGFARPAILFREILPNVLPVLIALLTLEMGIAVDRRGDPVLRRPFGLLRHADLGRHDRRGPPDRPSRRWWVLAAPLAALFATVLAFNQLGDGLRRAPRSGAAAMTAPLLAIEAI